MATKVELEAELADLRKRLADRDAADAAPEAPAPAGLADYLSEHGFDTADMSEIWEQVSKEFAQLQKDKPLLTTLGVFALGVMLGRMSKT